MHCSKCYTHASRSSLSVILLVCLRVFAPRNTAQETHAKTEGTCLHCVANVMMTQATRSLRKVPAKEAFGKRPQQIDSKAEYLYGGGIRIAGRQQVCARAQHKTANTGVVGLANSERSECEQEEKQLD